KITVTNESECKVFDVRLVDEIPKEDTSGNLVDMAIEMGSVTITINPNGDVILSDIPPKIEDNRITVDIAEMSPNSSVEIAYRVKVVDIQDPNVTSARVMNTAKLYVGGRYEKGAEIADHKQSTTITRR
ncbi:hypothetical protein H8E77_41555, partial [bacterium]|nr:hypothetical protein [bacterium]